MLHDSQRPAKDIRRHEAQGTRGAPLVVREALHAGQPRCALAVVEPAVMHGRIGVDAVRHMPSTGLWRRLAPHAEKSRRV